MLCFLNSPKLWIQYLVLHRVILIIENYSTLYTYRFYLELTNSVSVRGGLQGQSSFDEIIQQCWLLPFFPVEGFYWLSSEATDYNISNPEWSLKYLPLQQE